MAPMPYAGAAPAAKDAEGSNRLRNEGVRNFGNQRRMISELERINALNLEPSLPKQEDGNRNVSRLSQNREGLKNEFQQFLKGLQATDNKKPGAAPVSQGSGGGNATSAGSMQPPQSSNPQVQVAKQQAPGNVSQSGSSNPPFMVTKISNSDGKTLGNILDAMLTQASSAAPDKISPEWPEAQGPSFHDVLGEPQPGMPGMNPAAISPGDPQQQGSGNRPVPPQQNMPGAGGPPPSNPRQPPQGPTDQAQMRPMVQPNGPNAPGQAPHPQAMPPQGYVMAQGPPGQVGPGGQPQMQMFPMQGMGPGGPQTMQPIQGMQMQGQSMIMMGNQMMMAPNQMMAVPGGMMPAPGPGGQMPQGMGISPMPQMQGVGGDQQQQQQQQQQMMYVPMMMTPDGAAFMPQQGMPQQPFAPQQGGQPGNPQQPGPYAMMQQPMFHPQQPPDNRQNHH